MVLFLRVWKPAEILTDPAMRFPDDSHSEVKPPAPLEALPTGEQVINAWMPWVILCVVLAFWATDYWKHLAAVLFAPKFPIPGPGQDDHGDAARWCARPRRRPACSLFSFLTYSGTGVLVSGIIAGLLMGFSPVALVKNWFKTIYAVRFALITITLMLSLATLTGSFRHPGHPGPGLCRHRRALPLLQRGAGLAGRGGDRLGHLGQRPVRRPAGGGGQHQRTSIRC